VSTLSSQPDPRRWRALAVLGLIQFMLVVDVSIVNVALPRIQHDLHFSHAGLRDEPQGLRAAWRWSRAERCRGTRVGAVLLVIGGTLVLALLERVSAEVRNPLAEAVPDPAGA
jgi:MFS family permease